LDVAVLNSERQRTDGQNNTNIKQGTSSKTYNQSEQPVGVLLVFLLIETFLKNHSHTMASTRAKALMPLLRRSVTNSRTKAIRGGMSPPMPPHARIPAPTQNVSPLSLVSTSDGFEIEWNSLDIIFEKIEPAISVVLQSITEVY